MYIVYHGFVVNGGRSWCGKRFVCGLPALVVLGLWFALLVACLARPASEEEVSALVVLGLWPAQFVAWLAGQLVEALLAAMPLDVGAAGAMPVCSMFAAACCLRCSQGGWLMALLVYFCASHYFLAEW